MGTDWQFLNAAYADRLNVRSGSSTDLRSRLS